MANLTARQKTAYALGGLAMNLTNLVISQWIYKRYVPSPAEALVPVGVFSFIFFLGRASDAITDPLLAWWSDRARYRRGRRIPFILWGLVPLALVFFLVWLPPIPTLHWVNTVWAFACVQLFFILYTVVVTPYLALLPEITADLSERINISTLQAVFVMVGTAIFAVIGVVLKEWGWAALGGVVSVLTLISFGPTLLFIREKPQPPVAESAPGESAVLGVFRWIGLTFKNGPFIHVVVSTSFYWFGLNLLIMLVPYWVQDLLGLDEGSVPLLMGPFLAMNLVFFFIFNVVARRFGKFLAFLGCIVGTTLLVPGLAMVGHLPGSPLGQSAVAMGLIGIPVAGFMMLPFAIISDVVDYDEQLTGQRREAIYFGVQAILQKTMIGASIFVFGTMVLSGGDGAVRLDGLRWIPIVAAVSFALGFLAFFRYPLREIEGKVRHIRAAR